MTTIHEGTSTYMPENMLPQTPAVYGQPETDVFVTHDLPLEMPANQTDPTLPSAVLLREIGASRQSYAAFEADRAETDTKLVTTEADLTDHAADFASIAQEKIAQARALVARIEQQATEHGDLLGGHLATLHSLQHEISAIREQGEGVTIRLTAKHYEAVDLDRKLQAEKKALDYMVEELIPAAIKEENALIERSVLTSGDADPTAFITNSLLSYEQDQKVRADWAKNFTIMMESPLSDTSGVGARDRKRMLIMGKVKRVENIQAYTADADRISVERSQLQAEIDFLQQRLSTAQAAYDATLQASQQLGYVQFNRRPEAVKALLEFDKVLTTLAGMSINLAAVDQIQNNTVPPSRRQPTPATSEEDSYPEQAIDLR